MPVSCGKPGFWSSVAVLAGALALAGGTLVMGEGREEAQADGAREPRSRGVEDLLEEVEQRVPGFAGMFVDEEQDVLYVYSLHPSEHVRAAAAENMTAVFGHRLPVSRIEVLPARLAVPSREDRHEHPQVHPLDRETVVEARFFEQEGLVRGLAPRSGATLALFLDLACL